MLDAHGLLARPFSARREDPVLTGADSDSRHVRPGHIFVCKGAAFKPDYLVSAIDQGAVAYLANEEHADELARVAGQVPALIATDIRRAMALCALECWGHPDKDLTCIGITGTKGKSTTSYMLRAILEADAAAHDTTSTHDSAAACCALIGSIETFDGIERAESINTTPEACDLWRHISNARTSGLTHLVMEVSSQALKYDRIVGLHLDVAAFLNIGSDHISPLEHPTWEDYFTSKLRIFKQARTAVINLGSDHLERILDAASVCDRTLTFSANGKEICGHTADVWCDEIVSGFGESTFLVHTPRWEERITLPMAGAFNVENALAAITMAEACSVEPASIKQGLSAIQVPGRMELVMSADKKIVGIVDFAHNALAFSKFGPSVKQEFPGYKIISVFGATGDKATERRYELPQEAAAWSDYLIFTKDDPGHERPEDICQEMSTATPPGTPHQIIPDRQEAITAAVARAAKSTEPCVVCVLARGTEGFQHENGKLVAAPLDMDMLKHALAQLPELPQQGI